MAFVASAGPVDPAWRAFTRKKYFPAAPVSVQVKLGAAPYGFATLNGPPFSLSRYWYSYAPAEPPVAAAVKTTVVPGNCGLRGSETTSTSPAGRSAPT